jgi:sec-independent protein translocase protein TatA
MSLFAFFGLPIGPMEVAIIGILAVLLFGRKLPEMGRYMGKSIVEFRKGMKGLEDDLDSAPAGTGSARETVPEPMRPPQRVVASAPKFEDSPAGPPQA